MDVEATQTVDKMNFVSLDDVDSLLVYKPYYHPGASIGWHKDKLHIRDVAAHFLLLSSSHSRAKQVGNVPEVAHQRLCPIEPLYVRNQFEL